MPDDGQVRRGQPLLFLGLLLVGWVSLRVALWEPPWPMLPRPTDVLRLGDLVQHAQADRRLLRVDAGPSSLSTGNLATASALWAAPASLAPLPVAGIGFPQARIFAANHRAIGQNLLWMAGMTDLPLPNAVDAWLDAASPAADLAHRRTPPEGGGNPDRWRVDGWLVLREGSGGLLTAGDRPSSYGASQAGAVLGFRLAPRSRHDPVAYLRASKALVAGGETEGAAGFAARPFPGLPVNLHAEIRIAGHAGRREVRPAVFASAGLPDTPLPLDLKAEAYAQAGYVGGDFATGFVDGRVTVAREIRRGKLASLDAGLGLWGGAQRDAARLDIGPRLQVSLHVGDAPARLSADYRIRIAGGAEPGTGAAITLSTGF
ncbi:MAG: hypothetical protein WC692_05845 [Erythrobacter sp.]|jgi:hypothetical protein